jgi:hypothetical protein
MSNDKQVKLDKIDNKRVLYSARQGFRVLLVPGSDHPIHVRNTVTGQIEASIRPSVWAVFGEGVLPRDYTAKGAGNDRIRYRGLDANAGKLDYDQWVADNSERYGLTVEDTDRAWARLLKGPGYGHNYAQLQDVHRLVWGIEGKAKDSPVSAPMDYREVTPRTRVTAPAQSNAS